MEKKGYKNSLLLALGASAVLYLAAYLPTLFFPSSMGTLATLWSLLLFAVLFAVSVASRRLGERIVTKELTRDIDLDVIPPGKTTKYRIMVEVGYIESRPNTICLVRDTTRRVVDGK